MRWAIATWSSTLKNSAKGETYRRRAFDIRGDGRSYVVGAGSVIGGNECVIRRLTERTIIAEVLPMWLIKVCNKAEKASTNADFRTQGKSFQNRRNATTLFFVIASRQMRARWCQCGGSSEN